MVKSFEKTQKLGKRKFCFQNILRSSGSVLFLVTYILTVWLIRTMLTKPPACGSTPIPAGWLALGQVLWREGQEASACNTHWSSIRIAWGRITVPILSLRVDRSVAGPANCTFQEL